MWCEHSRATAVINAGTQQTVVAVRGLCAARLVCVETNKYECAIKDESQSGKTIGGLASSRQTAAARESSYISAPSELGGNAQAAMNSSPTSC